MKLLNKAKPTQIKIFTDENVLNISYYIHTDTELIQIAEAVCR
jgi:hypothetical protein